MLTSHAQQSYNPFSVGTATPIPAVPQHIYIQHRDPKGDYYNVELATAGFPRDGTLQTLTHSTSEAIRSGIALRQYDDRQSIGLCMVQLAKSYEHRYHSKDADFLMQCAETVLQYDSLNLNALLLKQQVLDERLMAYCHKTNATHIATLRKDKAINATLSALEQHSDKLYHYGYRQMPIAMQQIILSGSYPSQYSDANPTPFTTIKTQDPKENSYTSLYEGLFQEVFTAQPTEQYGHIVYNTMTRQLSSIDTTTQEHELIDPVAFAYDFGARMYDARIGRWMSTDPLERKYPSWSPYNAFNNSPITVTDPTGEGGLAVFDEQAQTITIYSHFKIYGSSLSSDDPNDVTLANTIACDIEADGNNNNNNLMMAGPGGYYPVKFYITAEIVTEQDAIKSAKSNITGTNTTFDPRLNFARIEAGLPIKVFDQVTTEFALQSNGRPSNVFDANTGDNSVLLRTENLAGNAKSHEYYAHILGSRVYGAHLKSLPNPTEVPMRATIETSTEGISEKLIINYNDPVSGRVYPAVNTELREVTQTDVGGFNPVTTWRKQDNGTSTMAVGGATNTIFEQDGQVKQ